MKNKIIYEFIKSAIQYMNKEIALESNSLFRIDGIGYKEEVPGRFIYHIKYGTSINGGIELYYVCEEDSQFITISGVVVYAKDKNGVVKVYNSNEEICNNLDAINMLNSAIADLNNAKILGECKKTIEEESYLIQRSRALRI